MSKATQQTTTAGRYDPAAFAAAQERTARTPMEYRLSIATDLVLRALLSSNGVDDLHYAAALLKSVTPSTETLLDIDFAKMAG